MQELSLRQIQMRELQILLQFDGVCREQQFRYSLGGGTLLGAVRHEGFIPWDDDVDVMMPRPDYDRFIAWCQTHKTPFQVLEHETTKGYYNGFAKLSDPATVIEDDDLNVEYEIGISIDVFPLEGLGATESEALRLFRKTSWDREVLNASTWKKYFRSKTHSIFVEPLRLTLFVFSRFANPKKLLNRIDRKNRARDFDSSCYAGCVWGSYRTREIMTRETFSQLTTLPFEGKFFSAISAWDAYLKKHYNDYMKLPPENKRQTHHTYHAYLREGNE